MHHLGYYLARASVAVVPADGGAGQWGHVGIVLRNEQMSLQEVVSFFFPLCSSLSGLGKENTTLRYDDFGACQQFVTLERFKLII